jgi:hypothetical protein
MVKLPKKQKCFFFLVAYLVGQVLFEISRNPRKEMARIEYDDCAGRFDALRNQDRDVIHIERYHSDYLAVHVLDSMDPPVGSTLIIHERRLRVELVAEMVDFMGYGFVDVLILENCLTIASLKMWCLELELQPRLMQGLSLRLPLNAMFREELKEDTLAELVVVVKRFEEVFFPFDTNRRTRVAVGSECMLVRIRFLERVEVEERPKPIDEYLVTNPMSMYRIEEGPRVEFDLFSTSVHLQPAYHGTLTQFHSRREVREWFLNLRVLNRVLVRDHTWGGIGTDVVEGALKQYLEEDRERARAAFVHFDVSQDHLRRRINYSLRTWQVRICVRESRVEESVSDVDIILEKPATSVPEMRTVMDPMLRMLLDRALVPNLWKVELRDFLDDNSFGAVLDWKWVLQLIKTQQLDDVGEIVLCSNDEFRDIDADVLLECACDRVDGSLLRVIWNTDVIPLLVVPTVVQVANIPAHVLTMTLAGGNAATGNLSRVFESWCKFGWKLGMNTFDLDVAGAIYHYPAEVQRLRLGEHAPLYGNDANALQAINRFLDEEIGMRYIIQDYVFLWSSIRAYTSAYRTLDMQWRFFDVVLRPTRSALHRTEHTVLNVSRKVELKAIANFLRVATVALYTVKNIYSRHAWEFQHTGMIMRRYEDLRLTLVPPPLALSRTSIHVDF